MMRIQRSLLLLVVLAFSFTAMAQDPPPPDIRDLVGTRASGGENAMRDRGYEVYNTQKGSDRIWTTWWKQSSKTCVTVVTLDGRYDSIISVPSLDCGLAETEQKGDGSHRREWVKDLLGGPARNADAEFAKRDFRNVHGIKEDMKSMTWWYRKATDICMKMTVADGTIEDMRPDKGGCAKR